MGTIQIDGSTPKITVGNATAEDATILFDGNAQDFYIALDDSADDLLIGLGSTVGTTPIISIDENKLSTFSGAITVGVDNTGHDVKLFGATAGSYWLWDESADGVVQVGTLTVGVDDAGHDVKLFGNAAGAYMEWDASADELRIMGASADATTSTGKLLLATSLTDINANDVIGKIDFQAPHEGGGTDAITVAASIRAIAQATFSSSVNATDLIFYTGHSEAAAEKIRFTSQNEIGIAGANYGTDGQVLTSGGAGAAVAWEDAGGSADPASADGDTLGTASLEWSDLYLADSSVIYFGADQDTTLTHTDGTGLTLNSTNKLCFNDVSQFVQGISATVLGLGATDEIDLTATTVDLNGTLDVSGIAYYANHIYITKTSQADATVGHQIEQDGRSSQTRDGGLLHIFNRLSSDGDLVRFSKDTGIQGTISVSGSTVSYGAFCGSHWSRLADNSKPTILRGTVLESIATMMDWHQAVADVAEATDSDGNVTPAHQVKENIVLPDAKSVGDAVTFTSNGTEHTGVYVKEDNEQLPMCKISDTEESKSVYGVFMAWDDQDDGLDGDVNDMHVASLGAFVVRVHSGETVAIGDYLQSRGDGTAKVQADDIMRASTIAKVTSTEKTHIHADSSYCVPCTLHCG
jgi:hypothetical protein